MFHAAPQFYDECMSRPRILIPIPTSFDQPYNAQSWPEYAAAVVESGGEAVGVALTHSAAELKRALTAADGLLLPGSGADVDPALYGHEPHPASAEPDLLRQMTDRALLDSALRLRKPVFGICMGMQSLNVFHCGTLIQDLDPVPVNHRAGRAVAVAHMTVFSRDSRLGHMLAATDEVMPHDERFSRLPVNSSHHQAVATPGETLRITARCPEDGVIEAVEGSDPAHWLVGVQWHPERTMPRSPSRALFRAFVQAAGA